MGINSVNSRYDTYSISVPFTFSNGRVATVLDDTAASWRQQVLTILSTNEYERVWHRHFGASLQNLLFQPESEAAATIPVAIQEAFVRWLPKLSLVEVTTDYDEIDGGLLFNIIYKLPTGGTDSVKITYAELTRAGETVKVIS